MSRMIPTIEVAELVAYLSSEKAAMITEEIICLDGGFDIKEKTQWETK